MPSHAVERYEDRKTDFVVKDFAGINTQAARTAIQENEFSWLENAMPIGYANIKIVPGPGTAQATIPNVSINYMQYVNINSVDYLICFTVGGGGYAVNLSSYAVTTIGGGGTFTGTVSVTQWKDERALIIASNNYWSWEPIGGLVVLGGTTGAPSAGQTIATFAGRTWIGNNRTVTFSAPNSYTDFTTGNSGGSFIITDSTLHSNINAMITANNFLYIFGDSSINVISDVRLGTGTPIPTLFSNTNVSALIGSSLPLSIFPFYRTIAFATKYGFYALIGATAQKISDNLDGIFPLIDFTKPVSGGVSNIYNILSMGFLFSYKDPNGQRPLLAHFFNKKWFFSSQGSGLTLIAGGFQSATPALFGTDGTNIYKLFSDTTSAISSTVQTALWHLKTPTRTKQALKAGVEITVPSLPTATSINITVDTDSSTLNLPLTVSNTGQWYNSSNVLGDWINNASTQGQWVASGFQIYQSDIESYGRYIGYTIKSTTPGYALNGALLQHEARASWAPPR